MTETQRRIRAYKRALPHMKERVIAVALLLAMSISMMSSATFAWLTLSRSPEVSGLATTIATNGNLEIALSDKDGLEPDETAVGDGGQDVTLSNLTWGNLINLSDSRYGLEKVTLRPATLNTGALKNAPLEAVIYGSDGRIVDTTSDFRFTNYETRDGTSAFYTPEDGQTKYGVRAVSAVAVNAEGEKQQVDQMDDALSRSLGSAKNKYLSIFGNKSYINAVTQLASVYLDYRLNDADQDCRSQIENIYLMVDELRSCIELVKQNLLDIANLRYYVYCNINGGSYVPFKETDLLDGTMKSKLSTAGITIASLDSFMTIHKTFYGTDEDEGAYYKIKTIYEKWYNTGGFVSWEALAGVGSSGGPLCKLVDIPSTMVNGVPASGIGLSTVGELTGKDVNTCVITKGIIKDMDKLLGTMVSAKVDKLTVLGVTVNNIVVTTSAMEPWTLLVDNNDAHEAASEKLVAKNATATDTYGMAIDFWVRTNSADSLLILEGEYIKETVVKTDAAGNALKDDDGKPITETRVVGYQGVNRVWEGDDPGLPENMGTGTSTTQGSGSCYVFYPKSTEDETQCLKMLQAMTVAFVDAQGKLLNTASLDTTNVFRDGGRVLVPLLAQGRNIVVGQTTEYDQNGNEVIKDVVEVSHHITELKPNTPTRITAIMYLDGTQLSNSEVLAAGSIEGQLNIQFGTTENMVAVDDVKQKQEYYNITVEVAKVSNEKSFDAYDPENKPVVNLTLTLEGMDASTVKSNFVSMISQTQGAKQDSINFIHQSGDVWTAQATLNGAGTYQLRSIQIDGVDYPLPTDQIEASEVVVGGTTVTGIRCENWGGENSYSYMSADPYYNLKMEVDVSGNKPSEIQAVFANPDGNVVLSFAYSENNTWAASGYFNKSGTYELTYLLIDGSPVPLLGTDYKTLELNLGIKVRVFLSQPVNAAYKVLEEQLNAATTEMEKAEIQEQMNDLLEELYEGVPNDDTDGIQLKTSSAGYEFFFDGGTGNELYMDVSCTLTDDLDNPLTALSGLELEYKLGNTETNMDTNLYWNSASGYYEGEFMVTAPGNYSFRQLVMPNPSDSTKTATITSVISAPAVSAKSRQPVEYVGRDELYQETVTAISLTPLRNMSVVLAYAPAATVKMTLEHTYVNSNGEEVEETLVTGEGKLANCPVELSYSDDVNKRYTYTVNVPEDGTWKIVGLQLANVVYYDARGDKVYYDGVDSASGGTGWADMSQLVQGDDIVTTFLTTVKYNVTNRPNGSYGDGTNKVYFMQDNPANGMTVTLTDEWGNAIDGTEVFLHYQWQGDSNWSSTSGLPNQSFGSKTESLASTDGKNFTIGDMNFQLAGQYVCSYEIEINGTSYDVSAFKWEGGNQTVAFKGGNVNVIWTAPTIAITGVTPDAGTAYEVNLASGTSKDISSLYNYFDKSYASVYFPYEGDFLGLPYYSAPQVALSIEGVGSATSATVLASNNRTDDNAFEQTYSFSPDAEGNWLPQSKEIGQYTGSRKAAGTVTAGSATLYHSGAGYTLDTNDITINNQVYPMYLQMETSLHYVSMPASVTVVNSRGGEQQVRITGMDPIRIFSPDGRAFTVKLPENTAEHEEPQGDFVATGTRSEYAVDPDYTAEKWYVSKTSGCSTTYDLYTRRRYVTTTEGEAAVDIVTYGIEWTNQSNQVLGSEIDVTGNATITGTEIETDRVEAEQPEKKIMYEYWLHDTTDKTGQSAATGYQDLEYSLISDYQLIDTMTRYETVAD